MTAALRASSKMALYILLPTLVIAVFLGYHWWHKHRAFKRNEDRALNSQFLLYQIERLYIDAQIKYLNQKGTFAKRLTDLCEQELVVKDMCSSDLDSPQFLPYDGYGFRIVRIEVSSLPEPEKFGYGPGIAHKTSHALFAVPVGDFSDERDTYVVLGSGMNFRTRLTAQTVSSIDNFSPALVDNTWIVEDPIEVSPSFQVAPE